MGELYSASKPYSLKAHPKSITLPAIKNKETPENTVNTPFPRATTFIFLLTDILLPHVLRGSHSCQILVSWILFSLREDINWGLSYVGTYQHRKYLSISSSFLRMLISGTPTDFAKLIEETNLNLTLILKSNEYCCNSPSLWYLFKSSSSFTWYSLSSLSTNALIISW